MLQEVKCEILTVGNEILIGRTLNTNAHWLSAGVTDLGAHVTRCTTIQDDVEEIASTVRESIDRGVDWLLVCGGLGPTHDDKTVEGVARALKCPLALDDQVVEWMKDWFYKLVGKDSTAKFELTPGRLKMATLPKGATALRNPVGSAPGVLLEDGRSCVICMPGVPSEMKAIFERTVAPLLQKAVGPRSTCEADLEVLGLPESAIAPIIDKVMSGRGFLYVKSHPLGAERGVFRLRVYMMVTARSKIQAEGLVEKIKSEIMRQVSASGGTAKEWI